MNKENLKIIIVEIKLTDVDLFGKSDSYIKLVLSADKSQSTTIKKGDLDPKNNEEFNFITDGEKELKVEIWDRKIIGNDELIGSEVISLADVYAKGFLDTWIEIKPKSNILGGQCAEIHLTLEGSASSQLHNLLNQLSTELHGCLRKIIPDINEETINQIKKKELPDKYEEAEHVREKLIENQTHKYLSVAKQLEIEFTKIIYSERKTEEVALREEIEGLQKTIGQQKEVITKYTTLMGQWTKEFKELEDENKAPL